MNISIRPNTAQLTEHDCPGQEKNHFDIEKDEQDRNRDKSGQAYAACLHRMDGMPDSYGMLFASDGFLGPNNVPSPIAISATSVAKTIINAIATYSSILTPQNAHLGREFVLSGTRSAQYIIRDF